MGRSADAIGESASRLARMTLSRGSADRMKAAEEAVKKQREETQAHHVSYSWIALVVLALWLYSRRRRVQGGQGSQ
jgi:hypothetical protein